MAKIKMYMSIEAFTEARVEFLMLLPLVDFSCFSHFHRNVRCGIVVVTGKSYSYALFLAELG